MHANIHAYRQTYMQTHIHTFTHMCLCVHVCNIIKTCQLHFSEDGYLENRFVGSRSLRGIPWLGQMRHAKMIKPGVRQGARYGWDNSWP